jgi:hypothetical protein
MIRADFFTHAGSFSQLNAKRFRPAHRAGMREYAALHRVICRSLNAFKSRFNSLQSGARVGPSDAASNPF